MLSKLSQRITLSPTSGSLSSEGLSSPEQLAARKKRRVPVQLPASRILRLGLYTKQRSPQATVSSGSITAVFHLPATTAARPRLKPSRAPVASV